MEGKDGRTERATPKRRQKARDEGNMPFSEEIVSMVVLFFGVWALRFTAPLVVEQVGFLFGEITEFQRGEWNAEFIREGAVRYGMVAGALFLPVGLTAMAAGLVSSIGQTGLFFSMKPLEWKFNFLNPINGFKSLFSPQSLVKLGMAILKISLIAFIIYLSVRKEVMELASLSFMSKGGLIVWIFSLCFRVAVVVSVLYVFIAVLDWIYKKRTHEKGIMMSKEEVKEERKQYEPNPIVKKAQRKKMMEFSLMRMMAAVPKASVVITNPTHVAVALEYDPSKMDAPKVTAKGLRLMAERIKTVAREHSVPIIERPELARSLYKNVEVGQSIPAQFYEAVAEILAYLHRLGRRVFNVAGA